MLKLETPMEILKRIFENCTDDDHHLRGSVMSRPKDFGESGNKNKLFKRYTFSSYEEFEKYKDEIDTLIETFNARFYINPTIKSYKAIAFDVLTEFAANLRNENYRYIKRLYDSVGDSNLGIRSFQLWMLDIDAGENPVTEEAVKEIYTVIKNSDTKRDVYFSTSKTKNGYHMLVKPHLYKGDEIDKIKAKYGIDISLEKNSLFLVSYKQ